MGLCKCPKRVVTNQFCYEHKVNVCEYCMVTNHPKCIVLSYLKWLQDGDYNPVCDLCSKNLTDEECVRLVCYHVFHWTCINHYAKQLSQTKSIASFTCPSCNSSIFPSSNLVSPIADVLRKKFETVNWARIGLGLPKLKEEPMFKEETTQEPKYHDSIEYTSPQPQKSNETVVHIDEPLGSIRVLEHKYPDNVPRRLTHVSDKKLIHPREDYDDNKYRRKTESKPFADSFYSCTRRSKYFQFFRKNRHRRYFFICAFLFVAFFFFMLVLEKLGSHVPVIDDPMSNPNIRVNDADS